MMQMEIGVYNKRGVDLFVSGIKQDRVPESYGHDIYIRSSLYFALPFHNGNFTVTFVTM